VTCELARVTSGRKGRDVAPHKNAMMKSKDDLLRPDLSKTGLARLGIKRPFTIPSGIVTTLAPAVARIARDISAVGFLTTKTLSLAPRTGYREPILHEYYPGCFVNAVGLANPGAEKFRESITPFLPLHEGKPLFVSIMGTDPEEFLECALVLDPVADAFELNLSCPHVKGAGQCVGSDPNSVYSIIRLLKERIGKPIIPKLSPNLGDIAGMSRVCEEAGADALSLINTVGPGVAVDPDGNPILSNITGGLSGAGILPVGLKAVREAAAAASLPIIASGGISSPRDVKAYHRAGAQLFAIGSALAFLNTVQLSAFFDKLLQGLECEEEASSRPTCPGSCSRTEYFRTRVKQNKTVDVGVYALSLESGPSCQPGCFFFLRLPGVGEKPFSPAYDTEPLYLVRSIGPFTSALAALQPGAAVYMRGPYGRGFPAPEAGRGLILVGGGTGSAPILMAGSRYAENVSRAWFGFSGAIEPWFSESIQEIIPQASIITDPPGKVGEVVKALSQDMEEQPGAYEGCQAFVCGPTPMMNAAIEALSRKIPRDLIFMAREDIMRCGIGLCGSCGTEAGLRSCVDGPVTQVEKMLT
jgi:dihydroorotate dehydrogenase subfamily 1